MLLKEVCCAEKLDKILRDISVVYISYEEDSEYEYLEPESWEETCTQIHYSRSEKYLSIYLNNETLQFTQEQLLNAEIQGHGLYINDYSIVLYRKEAFNFGDNQWLR